MSDTLMQWAAQQRGSIIQQEKDNVRKVVESIIENMKQSIEESLKNDSYLISLPKGWKDHKERLTIIFSDVGIRLREETGQSGYGTGKLIFDFFDPA